MGRPTKYSQQMVQTVYWMARAGLTDEEMAKELGVVPATFYNWRQSHPDFAAAATAGKEAPDDLVEQSLFKRATGYEYTEEKVVLKDKAVHRVERTKRVVAPDTTACIFWLKNRRPNDWHDRQEVELGGNVTIVFPDSMKEPAECGDD